MQLNAGIARRTHLSNEALAFRYVSGKLMRKLQTLSEKKFL
jgi:hypothetical protein